MIQVNGTVSRSFLFPASKAVAYKYYTDFHRIIHHLPLISLANDFASNQFRVVYDSTELGTYRIKIYCDVELIFDPENRILEVRSIENPPAIKRKSGLLSSTGRGHFSSRSVFHKEGEQTNIEYAIWLKAKLPPPRALQLVPDIVIDQIALSITRWRMDTIIDTFIDTSIHEFRTGESIS